MEKNVFKDIEPKDKLPASAKKKVLDSIETAKLMLDFWDLFATKRVEMNLNILDSDKKEDNSESIEPKKEE